MGTTQTDKLLNILGLTVIVMVLLSTMLLLGVAVDARSAESDGTIIAIVICSTVAGLIIVIAVALCIVCIILRFCRRVEYTRNSIIRRRPRIDDLSWKCSLHEDS
ncbi:uncharacterized protein [Ptychodera flava]|uniref:uncharacterized protein n=1 Tax=Ptychodera flava TaxID=63121 RepID=UPI003969EA9E